MPMDETVFKPHVRAMFTSVVAKSSAGSYLPFPSAVFCATNASHALIYLRSASHIGKVKCTYLIGC